MNLIERLKGYDKAKLIIDNQINSEFQTEFFDINGNYYANDFGDLVIYRNSQWVDFDSTDPKFELFSITDLEAEVMQYRREHKIYEAGDKVVIAGNGSLFEVVITRSEYSDRYIALAIIFKNLARLKYADWYERDSVSHATAAEIAAGKRLEVV